jgi:hypothetical protein
MNIYSRYEAQTEAAWQASEEANAIGETISACAKAIFDAHGAETMAQLQRNIYKYTDCGPAVSFELYQDEDAFIDSMEAHIGGCQPGPSPFVYVGDKRAETITQPWMAIRKIGVSSIVENSDAEVPIIWLDLEAYADEERSEGDLPELCAAATRDFGKIVDEVNTEACTLWHEANDDEE